ncbi:MAG TPA: hypothetical protein PK812_07045 [Beijerinckiaceae bacterium]|nr:hypothetical protein [Beijerinckiaceae bacterium]
MPLPRRAILALPLILLGATQAAAGPLLDRIFPRGQQVCYGRKAELAVPTSFRLIRITRPKRFQQYDGADSRHVRIVINFAGRDRRYEDNASCVEDGDRLRCLSATCEGAGFLIEPGEAAGIRLRQGTVKTFVIWGCGDDKIKSIALRPEDQLVPMRRATGACIN